MAAHLQERDDAGVLVLQVVALALPVGSAQPGECLLGCQAQQGQRGQLIVAGLVPHIHQHPRKTCRQQILERYVGLSTEPESSLESLGIWQARAKLQGGLQTEPL